MTPPIVYKLKHLLLSYSNKTTPTSLSLSLSLKSISLPNLKNLKKKVSFLCFYKTEQRRNEDE